MPPDSTLNTDQVQWLVRLTGVQISEPTKGQTPPDPSAKPETPTDKIRKRLAAALKARLEEEAFADVERKALLIDNAISAITPLKETLRQAFAIEVTTGKQTRPFQALDGDLENSAYTEDLTQDATISKVGGSKKGKGGKDEAPDPMESIRILKEAGEAYKFLTNLRLDMQKHTTTRSTLSIDSIPDLLSVDFDNLPFVDGPETPLFTELELAQEIYTPLVQEHVLGEGFITDNFSKTQKMLDATNALYKEELKDAVDPTTGLAEFTNAMVDVGSGIASVVLSSVGANTNMAKTLLTGCTTLVKLSVTTVDQLTTKAEPKTFEDLLIGVVGVVGSMVGGVTGNADLGRIIGASATAGAMALAALMDSIDKGEPNTDRLVDFFGSIIKLGVESIPTNSQKGDSNKDLAGAITDSVGKAVKKNATAFVGAVKNGDRKAFRTATIGICMSIAEDSPSWSGAIADQMTAPTEAGSQDSKPNEKKSDEDKLRDTKIEQGKGVGEFISKTVEQIKSVGEKKKLTAEELSKLAEERFAEAEKEANKKEARRKDNEQDFTALGDEVTQQMERENEEFRNALKNVNDVVVDQATIAKLIAKIEQDRAIMSVAVAIGQAGFDMAANFFAPMAMGSEAIKMVANITAAVQRGMDLRKFVDEATGASAATSPYLSSIQNFVDNQANQLTHYTLAAALNGAKIAASAAACAFPLAAPAVPAVTLMQTTAEAGWNFFNKALVVKAWNVTKQSLADPKNRRLGLKARRVNPTLAKYAIAYGAVTENDPVAKHMANACGLTNEVLANKESGVAEVKMFLEKKFSDDNKVVGALDKSQDWAAKLPSAALEVNVLFSAYHVMSDGFKAKPAWSGVIGPDKEALPPGDLTASIRLISTEKLPDNADVQAVEQRLMVVGATSRLLRAERDRLGRVDGSLGDVIDEYVDLAGDLQETLAMRFVKLKVAASTPPPTTK